MRMATQPAVGEIPRSAPYAPGCLVVRATTPFTVVLVGCGVGRPRARRLVPAGSVPAAGLWRGLRPLASPVGASDAHAVRVARGERRDVEAPRAHEVPQHAHERLERGRAVGRAEALGAGRRLRHARRPERAGVVEHEPAPELLDGARVVARPGGVEPDGVLEVQEPGLLAPYADISEMPTCRTAAPPTCADARGGAELSEYAFRTLPEAAQALQHLLVAGVLERDVGVEDGLVPLGELSERVSLHRLGDLRVEARGLYVRVAEPVGYRRERHPRLE